MVDIHKLIAAISPDVYCSNRILKEGESDNSGDFTVRDMVKRIVKEELDKIDARVKKKKENKEKIEPSDTETDIYLKAAEKAELIESDYLDIFETRFIKGAFEKAGLKAPIEKHMMQYDSMSQQLEPMYFWILDMAYAEFGNVEKLVDSFKSSAGSGHFAEMQARATRMQEEAMKIFGTANTVLRSVLNIVYDLKEFKMVLATYDDYNQKENPGKRHAALLALKQRWMDNVDIKRGNTSIKGLALGQVDFVTLLDAFMSVDTLEDVKKIDLNDRVKRILEQRIPDFNRWLEESEKELRKRFEIEKTYLRSQVNSLQLYSRWLKPYLYATQSLEQQPTGDPNLVSGFNTSTMELKIIAKGKYDPEGDIASGELPKMFRKIKLRKYTPLAIVEFGFRSVPDAMQGRQGAYGFRGRTQVMFTSYALNDDELKLLTDQLQKDDINTAYKYIMGATDESLAQIKGDIYEFLGEGKKPEEKQEKKEDEDANPFGVLLSIFTGEKKKKGEKQELWKPVKKDDDFEKILRSQAILEARAKTRKMYDAFKKANNMQAFPPTKL